MTTIVWFRQDLRVEDHPPLMQAMKEGEVIPLYIWEPEEEGKWPLGSASKWWLHHSLKSLEKELADLNLKLIIKQGPALSVLKKIMKESKSEKVYWSRRYEPASILRDQLVKSEIKGAKSFKSSLLFEPWEALKPDTGTPYKVFTPFYNRCLKLNEPEKPLPKPAPDKKIEMILTSDSIEDLKLLPHIHWDTGIIQHWKPGAPEAKKILSQFHVEEYVPLRDFPAVNGVSHLSPYLHFGEISPRMIWHALKDRPKSESFLRQIIWREFAFQLLYHFPTSDKKPLRKEWNGFEWPGSKADLERWQKGETGYPIVDAGMRQLWATGWMHNRVRMIVGSFLVKDLLVSWVDGAEWFWDTLVDADLPNNTFGWQWVAGCGADAAPYFRIFNPVLQGQKFDPDAAYIKKWIPELSAPEFKGVSNKMLHNPWLISGFERGNHGYPLPMVDHDMARKRALLYKR